MEGLEGYFTPSNPFKSFPSHLKNLPNKVIDPLPSPSLYSPLIPLHPNRAWYVISKFFFSYERISYLN
jgi:hypothetical protein